MSHAGPEDTSNGQIAASVFDLLLIELVPLAYRINADIAARDEAIMTEESRRHLFPRRRRPLPSTRSPDRAGSVSAAGGGTHADVGIGAEVSSTSATDNDPPRAGSTAAMSGHTQHTRNTRNTRSGADNPVRTPPGARPSAVALGLGLGLEGADDDDEDDDGSTARESARVRLDALGYRVGQGLAEKYSADLAARPTTQLECIKFVCKDLWIRVFRKQIDNLKTNHRGTFVLTDNRFGPIARVSMDRKLGAKAVDPALARVQTLLWFPCGIIRGALSGLGMNVDVHADSVELPVAVFQIRSIGAKT